MSLDNANSATLRPTQVFARKLGSLTQLQMQVVVFILGLDLVDVTNMCRMGCVRMIILIYRCAIVPHDGQLMHGIRISLGHGSCV